MDSPLTILVDLDSKIENSERWLKVLARGPRSPLIWKISSQGFRKCFYFINMTIDGQNIAINFKQRVFEVFCRTGPLTRSSVGLVFYFGPRVAKMTTETMWDTLSENQWRIGNAKNWNVSQNPLLSPDCCIKKSVLICSGGNPRRLCGEGAAAF